MESSSLRIGWQDSLVTHGPIALRCPGSGRFPPMNAPLISVSFPNIVRNSRSRPIECEFWKMLQGHVLHQKKSGTHSQTDLACGEEHLPPATGPPGSERNVNTGSGRTGVKSEAAVASACTGGGSNGVRSAAAVASACTGGRSNGVRSAAAVASACTGGGRNGVRSAAAVASACTGGRSNGVRSAAGAAPIPAYPLSERLRQSPTNEWRFRAEYGSGCSVQSPMSRLLAEY